MIRPAMNHVPIDIDISHYSLFPAPNGAAGWYGGGPPRRRFCRVLTLPTSMVGHQDQDRTPHEARDGRGELLARCDA